MTDAQTPIRPAPRSEAPKEISSRERAALRAKEIREGSTGGTLDDGDDEFAIDLDIIPEGWSYEWKTLTIFGMDHAAHQINLRRKGWEPVPTSRHPSMMPVGTKGGDPITRKGNILMERPLELTEEARDIEKRRAKLQVRVKEEQLTQAPPGQFERQNKDSGLVKVKKSFEQMAIPEE